MATFGTVQGPDACAVRGNGYSGTDLNNDGGTFCAFALGVYDIGAETPTLTWAGDACTAGAVVTNGVSAAVRLYTLATADAGAQTATVAGLTNKRQKLVIFPMNDVTGQRGAQVGNFSSGATSRTVAVTTEPGDLVIFLCDFASAARPADLAATGDAVEVVGASGIFAIASTNGYLFVATAVATGTTTNMGCSWTPSLGCAAVGAAFEPSAAVGPTIDTQPQADTGLINGDPARRTTVYVCEASTADGGGITDMDWEEDGSPIVDGGIYDIVTTGIGTASATSTLTITRTVKTGTPFDIQCIPADANGSTPSDTVQDTWYTGPVISKSSGTTDENGQDTLTITSDYPNADGEFTAVTATAGEVTKQVSLHYEAP